MEEKQQKKRIAVFGSTGSIGTQTLEIIRRYPHAFEATILVAGDNTSLLLQQIREFKPKMVAVAEEAGYQLIRQHMDPGVKVFWGREGLLSCAAAEIYDMMMAAMSGCSGIGAIIKAIECGKVIALANKEALVVAGDLIMNKMGVDYHRIVPVDSEHSGVFQCLSGERRPYDAIVKQLTLTASGGPFRGKKPNYLSHVRKIHALRHPVWNMGEKISIDSATLMNKGLEMIEAHHLFGIEPKKIKAILHPQCLVHSFVTFVDASVKAQIGQPDMKIPIMQALGYPKKVDSVFDNSLDIMSLECLYFEPIDEATFRCFVLAKQALREGGVCPCVLNAANEVAVAYFLKDKIGFLGIAEVVAEVLNKLHYPKKEYSLEELEQIDAEARACAQQVMPQFYI